MVRILFEDTHLIVVDKPAGLLSQGDDSGEPSLVDWLRTHFGRNYVGLVHRLDRNTSGLLVAAKRTKAARRLTDALSSGELSRSYLGWVEGKLGAPARWVHFLLKDEATNQVRVAPKGTVGARESALKAQPLGAGTWEGLPLTLVQFELETGRSHQIRVQAAAEKHPLLGDPKYGKRHEGVRPFGRPALHSAKIRFPHPMSGETMEFEAPLPADMAQIKRL